MSLLYKVSVKINLLSNVRQIEFYITTYRGASVEQFSVRYLQDRFYCWKNRV